MTKASLDDLDVGDRVSLPGLGPGTVTSKDDDGIFVVFDATGSSGVSIQGGRYDRVWFLHQRMTKLDREGPPE